MMNTKHSIYSCALLLCLIIISGCVGTVQEAKAPDALKLLNPPTTFNFPGIMIARPISHDKVELEFFAAGSEGIVYSLFVNGSTIPLPIDPQSLLKVAGGRLLYTVADLLPDREYKFKITATNNKTGGISANENEVFARTFDNQVADFKGVSKVSLVPGNTHGAILVEWIVPKMNGIFTSGPFDPAHYEVTVISQVGGIANINNKSYIGSDRDDVLVPTPPVRVTPLSNPASAIIDGLAANTQYYVQVRAINTLYQNYAEDPLVTVIPVSREVNTRYLSIKTDPAGSLFDFKGDNVIVTNAPGVDAFDKIDVFWQPGSGTFSHYKVFARKYDGVGDPTIDDKLTEATMITLDASGGGVGSVVINVPSNFTTKRLTGLESYETYQIKVALCKNVTCPLAAADPNGAIISDLYSIKVKPTLAPFSGIYGIQPPGQFGAVDVVKLTFDPPLMSSGYATEMEFYCVDPEDYSQQTLFQSVGPIAGSPTAKCNGLELDTPPPGVLTTFSSQKVKGLTTDGTQEYCFAATPAIITGSTPEERIGVGTPADPGRIVRCSYPEVIPPTVAQFPGLVDIPGSPQKCEINGTTATVKWNLPTGGIYSNFQVYWREKSINEKFSFANAIAADPGYSTSGMLAATALDYPIINLMPGRIYQMGVLTVTDMPGQDLYSEYNLNVIDCVVPLPVATFNGFARIFSIGPKVDGRVPNNPATKAPPVAAWTYEALDSIGQPYEVAMNTSVIPELNPPFYVNPPGRDFGTDFSKAFDGAPNNAGYAMSKTGVISLAWEEVSMSYGDADLIFRDPVNQPPPPALRTNRTFGYKVYRSSDNKLTWKELTQNSGLIYAMDYTYKKRANGADVPTRMAFFTDYSVQALDEYHESITARDIDRARIYDYKIVPVFDGKTLGYDSPNHNIVRAVLPPPNMALVHRWMANRGRCLEINKTPSVTQNYSCDYNGIGSTPLTIPHMVGETALDQGGDLLIDRFELGCRYTRGDLISIPESGASYFDPGFVKRNPNDDNSWPLFKGYRTIGTVEDPTTPFKGCGGEHSETRGALGVALEYPVGFVAEYNKTIQGDCIGNHKETVYTKTCTTAELTDGWISQATFMVPGLKMMGPLPESCEVAVDTVSHPTTLQTKYSEYYAPNFVMQSEFLAVFHNAYSGGAQNLAIPGPTTTSLADSQVLSSNWNWTMNNCSINLAAIDGSGYTRPRWFGMENLHTYRTSFKGATNPLYSKTVDEITEVKASTAAPLTFYNGVEGDGTAAAFKLPNASLRNSPRYRGTTRLSRVMTSNSAKLPSLGRLSSEQSVHLCNNYFVQVGFATDAGNFAPEQAVKPKRPLRRLESITAAAWNETYDAATITDLENSMNTGSCNNATKNNTGVSISKGSTHANRGSFSNSNKLPGITGSSPYTGLSTQTDWFHTEKCVSRYGIQDMIGNVSEYNSDRIFCDYSQDSLNMGAVNGAWGGGQSIKNTSAGSPTFGVWNTNHQRDYTLVAKDGVLTGDIPVQFKINFRDATPSTTAVAPWANIGVDSGYCSPVDGNPSKRTSPFNAFKDVATNTWTSVFLPGGVLNTAIVEMAQPDQDAVYGWRNGDGRFLDFGPQSIGAPINKADTLSLAGASGNKYFNPIVGLPLQCNNNSCADPSLDLPIDNLDITTTALKPNVIVGVDIEPANIIDFPIGNSTITHAGVSEFQFSAAGEEIMKVTPYNSYGYEVLTEVTVDDPVSMANRVEVYKSFPSDFKTNTDLKYWQVRWDVYRGTEFTMTSGGKSTDTGTGRYSATWIAAAVYGAPNGAGTGDITSGARCGVMINQD